MQELMDICVTEIENQKMEINIKKTKTVIIRQGKKEGETEIYYINVYIYRSSHIRRWNDRSENSI